MERLTGLLVLARAASYNSMYWSGDVREMAFEVVDLILHAGPGYSQYGIMT